MDKAWAILRNTQEMDHLVELVIAKCPQCNADLEVRPDQGLAVCNYCGSKVLLVSSGKAYEGKGGLPPKLEKKRYAIELESDELYELKLRATGLQSRISKMEGVQNPDVKGVGLIVMIFLLILIIFDIIIFPLFYALGMYDFYGISQGLCLSLGMIVLIIGLVGITLIWSASTRAVKVQRERAMQSPEYHEAVAEHRQLLAQIKQSEEKIESMEQELRSLL